MSIQQTILASSREQYNQQERYEVTVSVRQDIRKDREQKKQKEKSPDGQADNSSRPFITSTLTLTFEIK